MKSSVTVEQNGRSVGVIPDDDDDAASELDADATEVDAAEVSPEDAADADVVDPVAPFVALVAPVVPCDPLLGDDEPVAPPCPVAAMSGVQLTTSA